MEAQPGVSYHYALDLLILERTHKPSWFYKVWPREGVQGVRGVAPGFTLVYPCLNGHNVMVAHLPGKEEVLDHSEVEILPSILTKSFNKI